MRSFSQTTPTWVRGILAEDYGLDLRQIQWWSQQGAHVAEYRDPPWVQPLDPQLGLEEALLAGEVDAIIAGGGLQNPAALRHVIDDPAEAARRWHERTGIIPINHVVVVKPDVARQHPQAVRELYRLLQASRSVGEPPRQTGALDLQPAGFDAIHTSLLRIIHDTHAQGMISRRFSPEELYGEILDQLPDDKELTP